jgi:nucleoside-diphosphate-sugar epimerase
MKKVLVTGAVRQIGSELTGFLRNIYGGGHVIAAGHVKWRQAIADSWPNSLDDSAAREEWGWKSEYDLESMSQDMIQNLEK